MSDSLNEGMIHVELYVPGNNNCKLAVIPEAAPAPALLPPLSIRIKIRPWVTTSIFECTERAGQHAQNQTRCGIGDHDHVLVRP